MGSLPLLLFLGPSLVGRLEDPPPYEQLAEFASDFLGQWTAELAPDFPSSAKAEKLLATYRFTWAIEKSVIQVDCTVEGGGRRVLEARGLVGWDGKDRKIKWRWFASTGASGEFIYVKRGRNWFVQSRFVLDANGTPGSEDSTVEVVSPDVQVVRTTNRVVAGRRLPDQTLSWKRKR